MREILVLTVSNGDDSSTEGHEKAETESQEKFEETKGTEEIKDNEDKEALSQEYGFTVRIKPPYGDSFTIQVVYSIAVLFYYHYKFNYGEGETFHITSTFVVYCT